MAGAEVRWWNARPDLAELFALLGLGLFFGFLGNAGSAIILGGSLVVARGVISRVLRRVVSRPVDGVMWSVLGIAGVLLVPFVSSGDFRTHEVGQAAVAAIVLIGLVVLTGLTGQISLAQAALVGVGGYTTAILLSAWHPDLITLIVCSTVASGLAGLMLGVPALRLSGPYLAVVTVGIAVVFPELLKLDAVSGTTGGYAGLSLYQYDFSSPFRAAWLTPDRWHYFIAVALLVVVIVVTRNVLASPLGQAFRAVRDNPIAASACGVNVAGTKLAAFVISAAFAGLAGSISFVLDDRFVSPDNFTLFIGIDYLLALVIGGMSSIVGALLGALFLIFIFREGLDTISRQTQQGANEWLVVGAAIVAILMVVQNRPIKSLLTRLASHAAPRYRGAVSVLTSGAFVALAAAGLSLMFRLGTAFVDVTFLEGAISGTVLILVVLLAPKGMAALTTAAWPGSKQRIIVSGASASEGGADKPLPAGTGR
jgi:branched-chain amino acid transport system permease protein